MPGRGRLAGRTSQAAPSRPHLAGRTSTELLETEMQNQYFSRKLKSPEARAISWR